MSKKLSINILLVLFVLLTSLAIMFMQTDLRQASAIEIVDAEIGKTYEFNENFSIPEVDLTDGVYTGKATGKLFFPDGTEAQSNNVVLNQYGQYTVVYTAELNGEQKSLNCVFDVRLNSYEQSSSCSVSYGKYKYENNVSGLHVTLSNGGKFVYNKVIDVSNLTSVDTLLRLYAEPQVKGVSECATLEITLTDAYDSGNFVKIRAQRSPYGGDQEKYFSYLTTKLPGQGYVGTVYEKNSLGEYITGIDKSGRFGSLSRFSFGGSIQYGSGVTQASSYMEINYDAKDKTVWAVFDKSIIHPANRNSNMNMISDLDNLDYVTDKFAGFKTGEVILSLEVRDFTSNLPATFFISEIAGNDLSEENFSDNVAPYLEIVSDYDEEYPYAVINLPYKVFNFEAEDVQSGLRQSGVKAYKDHGVASQVEIAINDGAITPTSVGSYSLVYSAVDYFGNETTKKLDFEVLPSSKLFNVMYEMPEETTIYLGQKHIIPDVVSMGGSGLSQVETIVIKTGSNKAFRINDGEFVPESEGKYYVQFVATDYIGETKVVGYSLNVVVSDKAVFVDEPNLPKYFIEGFEYNLPEFYGYCFATGTKVKETPRITVIDGNGVQILSNGKFSPYVKNAFDVVTIKYEVGDSVLSYDIPCAKGVDKKVFNKANYFYLSDETAVLAQEKNIKISTTAEGGYVEFVNSLLADGFDITFKVDESASNFDKLNIYFVDSVNANEQIKITLSSADKQPTKSSIAINGGDEYIIPYPFNGSGLAYNFRFNNTTAIFAADTSVNINVKDMLDGNAFAGFSSGLIYVSFEFEGVKGDSAILLEKLNSCVMNSKTTNASFPEFSVLGEVLTQLKKGETIYVPKVISSSVLNPVVSYSMTVIGPDEKVATSIDGIKLEDVRCDVEYYIEALDYGLYEFEYYAVDSFGRANYYGFTITVIDDVPPTIKELSAGYKTYKVGDTVEVKTTTASDNTNEAKLLYYYCSPEGDIKLLKGEKPSFVVDVAGEWKVIYYAFDAFGNTTVYEYKVNVR